MQNLCLVSLLFFRSYVESFVDPITLSVIGSGILGYYKFGTIKYYTYCQLTECCNDDYVLTNLKELQKSLNEELFGQHIVQQVLLAALTSHLQSNNSRKPLVMSFHGTPGTGKNFVSDMIANNLYKLGLQSQFVHKYLGRADFPLESQVHRYKQKISESVRKSLAKCPRSLFIFDEVDKMPEGLFESLASLVDYNHFVDGVDSTKAIYIFLSNTGGIQISNQLGNLLKQGKLREDTKLNDFESTLEMASYNLLGGLHKSSMIESHVIDHFIPFLPLEKRHVEACAAAEARRSHKPLKHSDVQKVVTDVVTYDPVHGIFAKSGCKKLHKKISVYIC